MYKPNIVVYHWPCSDGITAAGVVYNYYQGDSSIEFVRGNYADKAEILDAIESWRDKDVLLVDFSYPKDILVKMSQSAKSILILDHHVTAQSALEDFIVEGDFDDPKYLNVKGIEAVLGEHKIVAVFDMNECGATMAWKFFNPNTDVPLYIQHIRDIDLGKKEMPDADHFLWASRAIPLDIKENADAIKSFSTESEINEFKDGGRFISKFVKTRIDVLKGEAHDAKFGNVPFRWGITDYALVSEYANSLLDDTVRFAVGVYFTKTGLGLSLRSKPDFDVSELAKSFGGGGHKQAAGVNLPWKDVYDFIQTMLDHGIIDLDI